MSAFKWAICLNMIVKNEAEIIEKCLSSAVGHIDCWVICDTGSHDGTQTRIRSFFAARGIPGILHSIPFENFEQARNEALDYARQCEFQFDYLLLMDADMELVVRNPAFRQRLGGMVYRALQKAGTTWIVGSKMCDDRRHGVAEVADPASRTGLGPGRYRGLWP